eukprot:3327301-Rhodomonas_salina.1
MQRRRRRREERRRRRREGKRGRSKRRRKGERRWKGGREEGKEARLPSLLLPPRSLFLPPFLPRPLLFPFALPLLAEG